MTKFLIATDSVVDLRNFPQLLAHVLERVRWESDLFIFANLSMDTLDYCGPEVNRGSKAFCWAWDGRCDRFHRASPARFQTTFAKFDRSVRAAL